AVEPHADTIGAADAVIEGAVKAAAADGGNVGRRRVEGIVHRAIKLDAVGPLIGRAEVSIDHRRHAVVVYTVIDVLALGQVVGKPGRTGDAGLGGQRPRTIGISVGYHDMELGRGEAAQRIERTVATDRTRTVHRHPDRG